MYDIPISLKVFVTFFDLSNVQCELDMTTANIVDLINDFDKYMEVLMPPYVTKDGILKDVIYALNSQHVHRNVQSAFISTDYTAHISDCIGNDVQDYDENDQRHVVEQALWDGYQPAINLINELYTMLYLGLQATDPQELEVIGLTLAEEYELDDDSQKHQIFLLGDVLMIQCNALKEIDERDFLQEEDTHDYRARAIYNRVVSGTYR